MKHILNGLLAVSAIWCISASADSFKLANGKVLDDPFVMSERPTGLEIGHRTGIVFVKFQDLPVEIQKKYNYDPAKAAQYEADEAARKEKRRLEYEKQKAEQAKSFEIEQKRVAVEQAADLGIKIQQYEARIAFLKGEIPRLESSYSTLLNKSVDMKIDNAVMNQTMSGGWNGGFLTTGGGQKSIKKAAIKEITDEAASTKDTLEAYKKELQEKQDSLIVMKAQKG